MTPARPVFALAAAAAALLMTACSHEASRSQVLVSAASSLTDAFNVITAAYEEAHPGVEITLNLGGSSALRDQILEGAPVDVFASANTAVMQQVVDAGLTEETRIFARNQLQIAVPVGNPAGIAGIEDFARDDLLIGVCDDTVPCGSLAMNVFAAAGIEPTVDSFEPNVRALLTKLEAGEFDAGLVYETDVLRSALVEGIDLPMSVGDVSDYPIAVISDAPNHSDAADFVGFVLSTEGATILQAQGFATP